MVADKVEREREGTVGIGRILARVRAITLGLRLTCP